MYTAEQIARIKWSCRRGMLELDTMIMPFFEQRFHDLPEEKQKAFEQLLDAPDPQLFRWLMRQERSDDLSVAQIADDIIQHNLSKFN